MTFQTFLEPANLLKTILLAISIFNLVAFLWLACTVWLNGDHRARITLWGVVGLSFAALFSFLHALLISTPLVDEQAVELANLLWMLDWIPALGVPYIWFAIGLHYASLINVRWRERRPLLLASSGILGACVFLLLILNRSTFTFVGTLQWLAYGRTPAATTPTLTSPLFFLPLLFLAYVTFCAIGPWLTPGRILRLLGVLWQICLLRWQRLGKPSLLQALVDAFWDNPSDVERLEEPELSWHMARPGLLLAALLMGALTTSLGIVGCWSMLNWLEQGRQAVLAPPPPISAIPLGLTIIDLVVTAVVALVILVIGYSLVRHGILIERPLARRGFFEQWRGIVIVATAVAIFIALLVAFTRSSPSGMLLIACLTTCTYALFTWSNYTAHDRYIALLGPFLRSTSLRRWLNTNTQKTEQELENLFYHLCHDVLAVRFARLLVLAGPMRRSFSYRWPAEALLDETQRLPLHIETRESAVAMSDEPRRGVVTEEGRKEAEGASRKEAEEASRPPYFAVGRGPRDGPERQQAGAVSGRRPMAVTTHRVRLRLNGQQMICWVLPIYDERGLVAMLYLGPRQDGGAFTDEDMNLAQACGQRILDTIGDHEAMQAVAGLLRRRIVDVKLLGAQQRRVLHDEILPQMHLALLQLETLRSLSSSAKTESAPAVAVEETGGPQGAEALNEAIGMISDAHRRLAAMMRATAPSAPYRLEREGLMQAIRTMVEHDFQNAFDEVAWYVSDETASRIDELTPPAIAELIFAAVQEALRNAARHARGNDVHRFLRLTLKASCDPDLELIVADDGVGIASASSATTGTGGGLLTHSALLAIAGGSLAIKSAPGEGVTVRILLPAGALL